MEEPKQVSDELSVERQGIYKQLQQIAGEGSPEGILKKLRAGFFLIFGYLLSPLCWWNDLVFNLPIAYFFGFICSRFYPDLLLPCAIAGYWLSNIAGILLMQAGALELMQDGTKERNFKQELLTGLASSTAYTFVILALIKFKVLSTPIFFGS